MEAFLPFVRKVADELGDLVGLWCTINEPNIYAQQAYVAGEFAPGRKGDLAGSVGFAVRPQFEEGSSGISDSIRYPPPLRRSTDIQSRSGSRVKTSSGRAGSTIHADSPISPSSWPGPHPE